MDKRNCLKRLRQPVSSSSSESEEEESPQLGMGRAYARILTRLEGVEDLLRQVVARLPVATTTTPTTTNQFISGDTQVYVRWSQSRSICDSITPTTTQPSTTLHLQPPPPPPPSTQQLARHHQFDHHHHDSKNFQFAFSKAATEVLSSLNIPKDKALPNLDTTVKKICALVSGRRSHMKKNKSVCRTIITIKEYRESHAGISQG